MPGEHNVSNALATIVVAHELGVSDDAIRKALHGFGGVKRRFTAPGEWHGDAIIDDYGHHPVEIAAVLRAARQVDQRPGDRRRAAAPLHALAILFEPFSTCFNDADAVIVAEVYAAGEAPIEGVDRDHLVAAVRRAATATWSRCPIRPTRGIVKVSPGPATTSSASAPATSRNGRMPCRAS